MQTFVPALSYEDVGAAVDWLCRVFGFTEEGERYTDDEGRVTHAELGYRGGTIMLGWPGEHYRSPRSLAELSEDVRRMLDNPYVVDGVLVYVDDIDAHHERARAEGAELLSDVRREEFGAVYTAADLEGHRWMFHQS